MIQTQSCTFAKRRQTLADEKYNILKVPFNLVDYRTIMSTIEHWRRNGERHYVTLTPPHSVLMCCRDVELKKATAKADLTLPDGIGIILAAALLGYFHRGRVTGPTLMLRLCNWGRAEGWRHFFYGGASGVADELAGRLSSYFPGLRIAGTYNPPFRQLASSEKAEIIGYINDCAADIVWVGLGSPKQEKWMAEHIGRINATVLIGVGAAFDFHSGSVKWAPECLRKLGLEWAYRLLQNPKGMWRRNLDSPLFLARVLHQAMAKKITGWMQQY